MDITSLLAQRQNSFIEARTKIEAEVDHFLKSLEEVDEDVQKMCGVTPGLTAKALLPSLWAEPFDVEVYKGELANLNTYIEQVRAIVDNLNREALACLQA